MNNITSLGKNQIFVFGSNMNGDHLGGAAAQAYKEFGAHMGIGEGITGQSYAFPTLDRNMQKRTEWMMNDSRDDLYFECKENPDKEFLLTKVGCGIAGYEEKYMKSLFSNPPKNLMLPEDWQ